MTQQNTEIEFYLNAIDNILSFYDDESNEQSEQEYLQRNGAIQTHLANDKDFFTSIKCLVDLHDAISKLSALGMNFDRYDVVTSNVVEKIAELVFSALE